MSMKTLRLAAAAAAALIVPFAASASDGTITFTGALTSTTCTVNGGTGSFTVTLPTLPSADLTVAGATAGATAFSIALTACPVGLATAAAFFEANQTIDPITGRLVNTAVTLPAQNVQLRLKNYANSAVLQLNMPSGSQAVVPATLSSGSGTARFIAEYYATGATTAGPVSSSVTYSMIYN